MLVASYDDSKAFPKRPRIYLEHGAGQRYLGADGQPLHGAYSGGPGHEGTVLFLCPNEEVARRWRERYPEAPAVAIGSPKLDAFVKTGRNYAEIIPAGGRPPGPILADGSIQSDILQESISQNTTIAFSAHWHCTLVPEADWAFPHFEPALPELSERFKVIGHGHPRAWQWLSRRYKRMGIEAVPTFDEVLRRASVFVCDNSSAMYEAAALGIPVVALNSPSYRRHINHGLRFWDLVPGRQCDHPEELADTIREALADSRFHKEISERVRTSVYPHLGSSASRGVEAIQEVLERGRHEWATPTGRSGD